MSQPSTINPRIIEGLYCEALVLSDEVRTAFALTGRNDPEPGRAGSNEDGASVAWSCEALRTTTRMMHAIAWLLNHRAYFAGELSEFQLKRYGKLAADLPGSDSRRLALIDPETQVLIANTERFYERLIRLDNGWRERDPAMPGAIARLRERLGKAVAR